MLTITEENYLKALLALTSGKEDKDEAGTNELAAHLGVKPATVNDMLKKLKEKEFIHYEKYGKISLTASGRLIATSIVRRHRLWETFLYEKLDFSWDEVHDVAEQLEHIQSEKLIEKLDKFLDYPEYDPHGDPIPKPDGHIPEIQSILLSLVEKGKACNVISVKDTSNVFLKYLQQLNIGVGTQIQVLEKIDFDGSLTIRVGEKEFSVSKKLADNLFVR